MKLLLITAGVAMLSATAVHAAANDIGFNPVAANGYCQDLAADYQVLNEDRNDYLSRCIADYRESPPGDNGSDISPHAGGY